MEFWLNSNVLARRLLKGRYGKMATEVRSGRDINDVVNEVHEQDKARAVEQAWRRQQRGIVSDEVNMHIIETMANRILFKSLYYCPVKTGALRASAELKIGKNGAVISYGNEKVDYASYVHELDSHIHKMPTQSKFLEDAAIEVKDEYLQIARENKLKLNIPKMRMQYQGPNQDINLWIGFDNQAIEKFNPEGGTASTIGLGETNITGYESFSMYDMLDDNGEFSNENAEYYNNVMDLIKEGAYDDLNDDTALIAFFRHAKGI